MFYMQEKEMDRIPSEGNLFSMFCLARRQGVFRVFGMAAVVVLSCVVVLMPFPGFAQKNTGTYDILSVPEEKKAENKKEYELAPRIFSSKLNALYSQKSEKLDILYDDLTKELREYAKINFVHQEKLLALVQPPTFENTRYGKEFKDDLLAAMKDLNKNYQAMKESTERSHNEYKALKETFPASVQSQVEILWEDQIQIFMKQSEDYFTMQGVFLNTYKNLVQFILNQSGGYYYDPGAKQLNFYKVGGYTYYGKAIEMMINTRRKQKALLEEMVSGYIEPAYVLPDE